MNTPAPRIVIDLAKLEHNARTIHSLYASNRVEVVGVTKAVLGCPEVAKSFLRAGIHTLADSRLKNLQRLRDAEVQAQLMLLRTPLTAAEQVVRLADLSCNTELATLEALSTASVALGRRHRVMLMVEMGDLREGVPRAELPGLAAAAEALPGLEVAGIGCNLACFGGVAPDETKMRVLSRLAENLETLLGRPLEIVSGGNSANHRWLTESALSGDVVPGRINQLRLGELLLLGRETLDHRPVPGLHTDAFTLIAEVLESYVKPTLPEGSPCPDAFGGSPHFEDRGERSRAILALGRQDASIPDLHPREGFTILGASSDHLILDTQGRHLEVGTEVEMDLAYAALLAAMTSPFVSKELVRG